jgi:chromosome segregation ATPase
MTRLKRTLTAAALVVAAIAAGASWRPVAAQATRNDDVLPALLTEVKGLRAAMEQMAAGSTQAQVLIGRLQLQESRVNGMIRRLDTVRDTLATARREYDQMRGAMQMLGKDASPNDAAEKDKEGLLAGFNAQVAAAKGNVDRLTAEELQLTADIATEQQRWVAINQRLDELERTLAKR